MAQALLRNAQAVREPIVVYNECVVQTAASGQSFGPKGVDLVCEAEGAGGSDLRRIDGRVGNEGRYLRAQQRMVEMCRAGQREAVGRRGDQPCLALLERNRRGQDYRTSHLWERRDSGRLNRLSPRASAAVQDRDLRAF